MKRFLVLWCAGALAFSSCRKKPSPEYEEALDVLYQLRALYGDEAVLQPDIARVEDLLKKVPSRSRDARSATDLLARIAADKKRLAEEKEARDQALADALKPPPSNFAARFDPDPAPAAKATEIPDAGAPQPAVGMSQSELSQRFSGCFRKRDPMNVLGKGMLDAWELKDIANCRDRHPGFERAIFLIEGGSIISRLDKNALDWRLPDGGKAPPP